MRRNRLAIRLNGITMITRPNRVWDPKPSCNKLDNMIWTQMPPDPVNRGTSKPPSGGYPLMAEGEMELPE